MLLHLFIAALWSPAGKGLTSWLLFVMLNCVFVTFACDILGQVRYLIVLIPDLCRISYIDCCFVVLNTVNHSEKQQILYNISCTCTYTNVQG